MTYRDKRYTSMMAQDAFEEGKHPRDDSGKFGSGSTSSLKDVVDHHGWEKSGFNLVHKDHPNSRVDISESTGKWSIMYHNPKVSSAVTNKGKGKWGGSVKRSIPVEHAKGTGVTKLHKALNDYKEPSS